MAAFTALMTDVLGIEMTVGTTTLSLGAIALGSTILGLGIGFFKSLKGKR